MPTKRRQPAKAGSGTKVPQSHAALDDFREHLAKRSKTLQAAPASHLNQGPTSLPGAVDKDDGDARFARLSAKYEALKALRETEPERLYAALSAAAEESSKASEEIISRLRSEKARLESDLAELSSVVGGAEAALSSHQALVDEKTALEHELARLREARPSPQPAMEPVDDGAHLQRKLHFYEVLTGLTMHVVEGEGAGGARGVRCRAAQGDGGGTLEFRLVQEAADKDIEFELVSNSLVGVDPSAAPELLAPMDAEAEEVTAFEPEDGPAFLRQLLKVMGGEAEAQ